MKQRKREMVLIINNGHKYNQELARNIRELGVYSELHPKSITLEQIQAIAPKGIVLTELGFDAEKLLRLNIPILAIDQGMKQLANRFLEVKKKEGASTSGILPLHEQIYGLYDHPGSPNTKENKENLKEFLFSICQCEKNWTTDHFIEEEMIHIQQKVGEKKVLCALSGGVDSSVAAALIHRAIGDQLTCIFVDHGLLRKNEGKEVMDMLAGELNMNIIQVDAEERFLEKLKGVTDPEEKRKIIGNEFISVFSDEAKQLTDIAYLAQGTLYSDVIESGEDGEGIKSHHNVGGLPEEMDFSLIEPLRTLFKDEVRAVGTALGLPDSIVWRQPFPGPGLGIRILGEVTEEKLAIVRESDAILREEIAKANLERDIWQYFTVLPDIRSVGMTDGERTYVHTIAIRAVHSVGGMTSEWARIPWDVLDRISTRIVKEVEQVNRVVYDITSKPPATIEWE